jgi:1-acyl-sn-glycerol-3-phosphate acyltransferase
MQDWLSYVWYETAFWTTAAGGILGYGVRTEGAHHVPRTGPVLVIANHQSFLDPVLVGLAARRQLCFLARHSLFENAGFGWLIRSLNAVPVNQDGFAREGLKTTLEQLRSGRAVLVFPEGERTEDGQIHPLRPGIHLLIKRVKMPILPVGIAGAYDAWPRRRKLPRLAPLFLPARHGGLAVSVARPLDSADLSRRPREEVLSILFKELEKAHAQAERLRRKPFPSSRSLPSPNGRGTILETEGVVAP